MPSNHHDYTIIPAKVNYPLHQVFCFLYQNLSFNSNLPFYRLYEHQTATQITVNAWEFEKVCSVEPILTQSLSPRISVQLTRRGLWGKTSTVIWLQLFVFWYGPHLFSPPCNVKSYFVKSQHNLLTPALHQSFPTKQR